MTFAFQSFKLTNNNMEHKGKVNTTRKTDRTDENTGGKAARVRRMRKGNTKTNDLRDANSDTLYNERNTR